MVEIKLNTNNEEKIFNIFPEYKGSPIQIYRFETSVPPQVTKNFGKGCMNAGSICFFGCVPNQNLEVIGVLQFRYMDNKWKNDYFLELMLKNGSEQIKRKVIDWRKDDNSFKPNHYISGSVPLTINTMGSNFTILPPNNTKFYPTIGP